MSKKAPTKPTPRPQQILAIGPAVKALRRHKKALVVMATGLGKTFTGAFIAEEYRGKKKRFKILFLVHNNFILEHAKEEFRQVLGEETSMVTYNGMSKNGAVDADVVFATWQTMGRNLDLWEPDHFDLIIVDEAHHSEAETYRPVVDHFTGAKLGLTATPDRTDDEEDIRTIFGSEVVNISLEDAIARGWLPRIEYHVITDESLNENMLQKIMMEIREARVRFTMAEVNRRIFIQKRDKEIARIINGYNEKAVVFCQSIPRAEKLRKWLDFSATFHSGKAKSQKVTHAKNQAVLDGLKNGTIRRVCAINAFNEGVNVPSVGLVAFCRATSVLTIFRQQLGRGLRPGKDKLIVLDFVGNLERIKLVLEMMNKIADLHEKYTDKRDREREGYVRQRFEVSGAGFEFTFSDKVVDLMKILEHCEAELYLKWQEAGQAAQKLGIANYAQYRERCKEDPRLPTNPNQFYKNFPGFDVFLGKGPKAKKYPTWQQSARVAKKLGINTQEQYFANCWKDPRLYRAPHEAYPDFPGYTVFLGKEVKEFYSTCKQASKAAKALNLSSRSEYEANHEKDSRLPSNPKRVYADFPGWGVFLGTGRKLVLNPYKTYEEASRAAQKLKVKNRGQYKEKRHLDSRLPAQPYETYASVWKKNDGWFGFLGKR